ncbi:MULTISPECIES: ATP-binding protein [unclassified Pseudomonas]|uniref:ATP-binding protein n=1 Tax=unclassified Pseudomonas TaxID=196821 RepID=UPI00087675FC|nr:MULTISPECIES: ATP-binding protein [unclassified Pseudomonas]SCZ19839.1 Histidine kinase-, DNA gyrase B-, and HSP90-like ATPase [Pseudomonas sp. NFACC44-2]SDA45561.1 Histidine kinase-, DNA gyrase B-, and HSP90-like ATPase [Pseudomonas sp. NFACC51]SFH05731.1 Histidine kinase-, DNA gyrase B-, and HSP90-like ATPase [Pseudomonas sp. NFACC54]SFS40178.1 Histidine kinase-, DNA gyrase B-, and HSP90-like ATPase [Pseudomonas sp. NFACC48-1]
MPNQRPETLRLAPGPAHHAEIDGDTEAGVFRFGIDQAKEAYILFPMLAALLLLAIWTATLYLIKVEHARAQQSAATASLEMGATYEAQMLRAIHEIDQTLKLVKYTYEAEGEPNPLRRLQERALLPPALVFDVSVVSPDGRLVASTRVNERENIADPDEQQTLRHSDSLSISHPWKSPVTGEWRLRFSRRLDAKDGRLSGIARVEVDAAYFVSSYDASKLGDQGALGLLGTDGIFRVRRTGETVLAGDTVNYSAVVPDAENTETVLSVNGWDGVRRYTSARQLYDFPLAVIVGLSEQEQLAAVNQQARTYLWRAAGGSLVLVLLVSLLARMSWQLAQSRLRAAEAQTQLAAAARQAGMAEIATNVLHNVGNVLNSVNISADLVTRKLRTSKALGLGKAVQMMNEHAEDLGDFISHDEKGKLLPGYLNQLVDALAIEQQSMAEELGQLTKSVDHIKEIVSAQQSYAGTSTIAETVQIKELIEDALRMNAGIIAARQITVVRNFAETPLLLLDKHRVLLILVNLIKNASRAMDDKPELAHQIILQSEMHQGDTLVIKVIDNGEGIAPENLTRIFAHGFTTRKDGHGFGLHSCVLAAMEMGGSLEAHSDGPGTGATFTLKLAI